MAKPKILVYADAGNHTGFERVQRGVLSCLQDKYNIIVMGIGYHGQTDDPYPYPVYPASTTDQDLFGTETYFKVVKKRNPDLIWLFQDMWNILKYEVLTPVTIPLAIYYPVDTPNMKWHYGLGTGAAASVGTYTQFGARETAAGVQDFWNLLNQTAAENGTDVTEPMVSMNIAHPMGGKLYTRMDRLFKYQDPANYHIIPHGLDPNKFPVLDKATCRREFGIPENAFVVLNVNTNQYRKRQDLTIRAFAELVKHVPNAILVLHCFGAIIHGYDLGQLARYHGVSDRVWLIHDKQPDLTDTELGQLYNAADVQINTAGGEGWGLPSFEGACCGVPQLVPDWSATRELWKDHGILLRVDGYRAEVKHANTMHAEISVRHAAETLRMLYEDTQMRARYADLAYQHAHAQPTWEDVAVKVDALFQAALNEPARTSVSIEQAIARRTVITSELTDKLWL
jgi:D-inositol-3-phosphate glycosyltransferase